MDVKKVKAKGPDGNVRLYGFPAATQEQVSEAVREYFDENSATMVLDNNGYVKLGG